MKRFFCSTCQKVRRIRNFPPDIVNSDSTVIEDRIGTCAFHSHPISRKSANNRVRMLKTVKKYTSITSVNNQKKGRK